MASDIVGFLGWAAAILVSAHAEGSVLIGAGSCAEEFPSVLILGTSPSLPSPGQPYRRLKAKFLPTIFSFTRGNVEIFSGLLMVNCQKFHL